MARVRDDDTSSRGDGRAGRVLGFRGGVVVRWQTRKSIPSKLPRAVYDFRLREKPPV